MKQKVFTLLTLLVLCVTGAWADDTYTVYFAASSTTATQTPASPGNFFTVNFNGNNANSKYACKYAGTNYGYGMKTASGASIKFTVPAGKTADVIIVQSTASNDGTFKYGIDGSTASIATSTGNVHSGDDNYSKIREYTFSDQAAGTYCIERDGGERGIVFVSVTVKTAGPKTATFTLSKTTIAAGETAKILVDGEDIFAANFTAGTLWESAGEGPYVTLSSDGIITAVKNTPDGYYCTFNANSKDLEKYNSSAGVRLDFAVATSYDITKGTHANGDFTITPASAAAGTEITLAATPSSGYDFASWTILKTSDASDVTDAVSLSSTTTATATFTLPAYGVTVNATFEAAKYTVTYDVNGGGSCATASEKQASAGAAVTLPTPTWDGYTFNGWYNAGTKIGDAGDSYTPTANITLYAKWTDNIEGKLFSYVDGNYGDKFQAFDASGWVTANGSNKSKTFTDGTTGAQFVVENGAWDKKDNSISALAKLVKGTSTMSIVIPAGYLATVKILYGAYGTGNDYKMTVNGTDQAAASAKFDDGHTNAQVASDMRDVILNNQSGTLNLSVHGNKNIYIARVAVTLTHESISTASGKTYATYVTTNALDFSAVSDDIKAYVAASTASAGSITFTGKDEVPASTPLLIKTASAGATVYVPVIASADAVGTNYLVAGSGTSINYNDEDGYYYYILSSGSFQWANNSNVTTNKAYLRLPKAVGANELTINFDDEAGDVTGIATVSSKKQNNGEYFNLNGQRVDASHKGIVIVNGKKFFNK